MARIRTVKPEYWSSEQVMACTRNSRLLFIGLWNFADDCGRLADSAKSIKAQIFPGDDDVSSESVRGMLDELSGNGLLMKYEVEGKAYIEITGWKHQRIDKPQHQNTRRQIPRMVVDHSRLILSYPTLRELILVVRRRSLARLVASFAPLLLSNQCRGPLEQSGRPM